MKYDINRQISFELPETNTSEISKIDHMFLKNWKSHWSNGIPATNLKTSADVIDNHVASIIKKDIQQNRFLENANTTLVRF